MGARFKTISSAALHGVEAFDVQIEASSYDSGQDSQMQIVGLPDAAVRESRDRVMAAIGNSGYDPPLGKCTVNLAPADLKKEGSAFDLPIALCMVAVSEDLDPEKMLHTVAVGELALNGMLRPVRGVLSLALAAKASGKTRLIVPMENAQEASVVAGIDVYGAHSLQEAYEFLHTGAGLTPQPLRRIEDFLQDAESDIDFADVKGQSGVKRAIEVAVAGGHNILMIGPPGTGKSMLAKRVATILPPMSEQEAIEATKIHSIAGLLDARHQFLAQRPYRAPHHTISNAGLLGGSSDPMPGEVSLAHHGVLFLDELPEFQRTTLEVMRQPLEDGKVTIARAAATVTYPSRFMLVSAMNPCPCGYFGDPKRPCKCHPGAVVRYRQRLSGPLLDRIDIHVEVPLVPFKDLSRAEPGEPSELIRQRVITARQIQLERYRGTSTLCNASMSSRQLRAYADIDESSRALLEEIMTTQNFSARAHDRILKVARTIADLEGTENVEQQHLIEAINFRTLDRNLWG